MPLLCRACLAGNVRMHKLSNFDLLLYEKLSRTKLNREDGSPKTVCYICYAQLLKCRRFSDMAHRSEKIFCDLLEKHNEATHDKITKLDLRIQNLTISQKQPIIFIASDKSNKQKVKEEFVFIDEAIFIDEKDMNVDAVIKDNIPKTNNIGNDNDYLDTFTTNAMNESIKVEQCIVNNKEDGNIYYNSVEDGEILEDQEVSKKKGYLDTNHAKKTCYSNVCSNKYISKCGLKKQNKLIHHGEDSYINNEIKKKKHDTTNNSKSDKRKSYTCDNCQKIFSTKTTLREHIITIHMKKSYRCKYGKKFSQKTHTDQHYNIHNGEKAFDKFLYKGHLTKHSVTHTRNKPYTCNYCGKRFSYMARLTAHITKVRAGVNPHFCTKCNKRFCTKSDLHSHITSLHHGVKLYSCESCEKTFTYMARLRAHTMKVHTGETPHACHTCENRFSTKSDLHKHLILIHHGEKSYSCDICDRKFSHKGSLKVHLKRHSGENSYSCDRCEKSFIYKGFLTEHKKIHSREKSYDCDNCGKRFFNKGTLKTHMSIHTGEKPFACGICEKKCRTHSDLRYHTIVYHNTERPKVRDKSKRDEKKIFVCDKCPKIFQSLGGLKQHMKTHTGEKPFACQTCDKCFRHRCTMEDHIMRAHSGIKPHACNDCDKKFASKADLRTHTRIVHFGDKPFVCSVCEKRCSIRGNLLRHMRTHTGEKPKACSSCDKRFSDNRSLKDHLKSIHGIGEGSKRKRKKRKK